MDLLLGFYNWMRERKYKKEFPALKKVIEPKKYDTILDVGAGTGAITNMVANICDDVYAVEPSEARVEFMRKKYPQIKALCGKAEQIPFPNSYFTKIYSIAAFHHYQDQGSALEEFARVLKPKGLLMIQERDPKSSGPRMERKIVDVHFVGESQLKEMVESHGFSITQTKKAGGGFFVLANKP